MKHSSKNIFSLRPNIYIWRKRRFSQQPPLRPFTDLRTMSVAATQTAANRSLLFITLTSIHNKNNISMGYSISGVPTKQMRTLTAANVLRWFVWFSYTSYSTFTLHLSYSVLQITRFAVLNVAPLQSNPRKNLPHLLPDKFSNTFLYLTPLKHL